MSCIQAALPNNTIMPYKRVELKEQPECTIDQLLLFYVFKYRTSSVISPLIYTISKQLWIISPLFALIY